MAGNEVDTLLGSLERQRAYIAWKCGKLDSAGLSQRLAPSTMTLGGLLKHLALVEDDWFSVKLLGAPQHAPFDSVDWDADRDWEWHSADDDQPDDLMTLWEQACERSRANVSRVLGGEQGLDTLAQFTWQSGATPNLRRMMTDMIEEYARHVGHADLIRESIDGLVGEDPE